MSGVSPFCAEDRSECMYPCHTMSAIKCWAILTYSMSTVDAKPYQNLLVYDSMSLNQQTYNSNMIPLRGKVKSSPAILKYTHIAAIVMVDKYVQLVSSVYPIRGVDIDFISNESLSCLYISCFSS